MRKINVKLLIYTNAILLGLLFIGIVDSFQYRSQTDGFALLTLGGLFALSFALVITCFKTHKQEPNLKEKYEGETSDKYIKRVIDLFYLAVYLTVLLAVNIGIAYLGENSKPEEILSSVRPTLLAAGLNLFFFYASFLELHYFCEIKDKKRTTSYFIRQVVIVTGYWTLYFVILSIATIRYFYTSFGWVSAGYAILVFICNLTFRKAVTVKNVVWKRGYSFIIVLCIVGTTLVSYLSRDTFYLQSYINRVARLQQNTVPIEYDDETGVYKLTMTGDDFKILQLTDIHFGGSISSIQKDYKALDAVYRLIEYTQPDLVIVTGDLTFPLGIMSYSLNNSSAVHQFAAFMRNVNIPWAFTFGNHDTEVIASMSKEGICDLYESLSFKTSGTLLYPYTQPDITGRNNQVIELYNTDGSLNQAIFLIDSNAYTGDGINVYDFIHDDQVDWYAEEVERLNQQEGKTISSLAFFHIPLQEYKTAYELYEAGSDEVKYYFGSNDEEMIDKICCSEYPSKLFDTMVEMGSTKAVFCGHDHYNNMSLEYQGIRLTYGMSIDYLAMPGIEKDSAQRGATLITIHSNSDYDIEQVPLENVPKRTTTKNTLTGEYLWSD